MPMKSGAAHVAENIAEFHHGKTYAATKARHGKAVADRQAIAAARHGKAVADRQAIAAAMHAAGMAKKNKHKTLTGR